MNPQEFRADLHIHSRFSRATSSKLNVPLLAAWAALKGINVLGTGDFTHPAWRAELAADLVLDEKSGLYAMKNPERALEMLPEWRDSSLLAERAQAVRFMLQAEISSIYKRGGKVRKVHNLIYMPNLEAAEAFSLRLAEAGNLSSDGRPILGLDSRDILELTLNTHAQAFLIPAHVWTPWFSLFGSKSGFDSLEECFGPLSEHIFALETGLSSDPEMNRRLSALDGLKLVSNSDAHSGENLAREANIFSGEASFDGIYRALRAQDSSGLPTRFLGTFEFFPDEGKYHLDGHRACNVSLTPEETRKLGGLCPVCGKPVTVGVLYRVQELADRDEAQYRADEKFSSLIPLPEMLGEVLCVGPKSRKVADFYQKILRRLGSELDILAETPLEDIARLSQPLAEGIGRMRRGEVYRKGGFDGEFGVISAFSPEEQKELKSNRLISVVGPKSQTLSLLDAIPEEKGRPRPTPEPQASAAPAKKSEQAEKTLPELLESFSDDPADPPGQAGCGEDACTPPLPAETAALDAAGQRPQGEVRTEAEDSAALEPHGLNPAQAKAAQAGPGPVLVIAGPGTGKTHTLVARVLHLMDKGIPAKKILAVTFTRRAARELDERLSRALRPDPDAPEAAAQSPEPESGTSRPLPDQPSAEQPSQPASPAASQLPPLPRTDTLHALAFEFWIRAQGTPVLLTEEAALRVFAESNIEESAQKRRAAWAAINLSRERAEPISEAYQQFYQNYTQHKTAWNLADYTDLLEFWLTQAKSGLYPTPWSQVLVDEVQDLSPLQLSLLQTLMPPDGEGFFGIGDPDQSIYGFRGAHGRAEEFFKQVWPGLTRVQLAENYRSGPEILHIAQTLFEQRAERELLAKSSLPCEIHFFEAGSAESEATWVAGQIRHFIGATSHSLLDAGKAASGKLQAGAYSPGDFAILVRSRLFMQPLRRALERAGIPVSQPGADPFWNEPRVIRILELVGRMLGISPAMVDAEARPGSGTKQLECPARVLTRGPLSMSAYWGNSEPFDSQFWQSEAFKSFAQAFETHQGWSGLFNWLSLQNELEMVREKSERVQLITLHASKGLEFPMVFMPALEDGILPFAGASFLTGQPLQEQPDVEEEKRLLYVGLTRAREGLFLSRAARRHLFGRELRLKPSRFLTRLPLSRVRHSAMVAKTVSKQEQLKLF